MLARDDLKKLAQSALEDAQRSATTYASIFGVISDGQIKQTWSVDGSAPIKNAGAACYVNAEDIPNGPKAGEAIYLGAVIGDDHWPKV